MTQTGKVNRLYNLLVVDPDQAVSRLVLDILHTLLSSAKIAQDIPTAQSMIDQELFDLIFIDLSLDTISSQAFISNICNQRPLLRRIILMTGDLYRHSVDQLSKLKSPILFKPFSIDTIRNISIKTLEYQNQDALNPDINITNQTLNSL